MANNILVSAEDGTGADDALLQRTQDVLSRAMGILGYDGEEVSVTYCTDALIRGLNAQYRNVDAPTDVLSFEDGTPYTDQDGTTWRMMGDIVISLETLPQNSAYFAVTQDDELKRLLVHGLLHLHGMDHGDEHVQEGQEPHCEMLRIQKQVLSQLGAYKLIG